jgi:hypothetical protein
MKSALRTHNQYVHLISVAGMIILAVLSVAPFVGAFTKGMAL